MTRSGPTRQRPRLTNRFRLAQRIARQSESTIWTLHRDGQRSKRPCACTRLELRLLRDGDFMWSRVCPQRAHLMASSTPFADQGERG